MNRVELFVEPISYIKDGRVRNFVLQAIEFMPEYFFTIPASSTGRHHPAYALGEGGLLRHTIAAVRIAMELFIMEEHSFSNYDRDLIIASLILHDGWKSGLDQKEFTVPDHPLIAAKALYENKELMKLLPAIKVRIILANIKSHMGQWNTDWEGKKIMPKPRTKIEKFVHLCDYLASRKCLEMNFDIPIATK